MQYENNIILHEKKFGSKKTLIRIAMDHKVEYKVEDNEIYYSLPWYDLTTKLHGTDWVWVVSAEQALRELGY